MSLGYGAKAVKFCQDNNRIIFEYGNYNWNISKFQELKIDGIIMIENSCFDIKDDGIFYRIQRGKKLKIEINDDVLYSFILKKDKIKIENCTQCWGKVDGVDIIAWRVVNKIFDDYLKKNTLQKEIYMMW